MAENSSIEWTDASWSPVTGCTRVSAGCDHCYSAALSKRLAAMGQKKYQGIVGNGHFNGVVKTWEDELTRPLRWRKPRRIFVNSMSDTFHKSVPFEFIDKVFAVMALCPQHTFQVLTKRPERMAEYFADLNARSWAIREAGHTLAGGCRDGINYALPLPNVWLGTSVEDQRAADERMPHLRRCPAAVRFLSCEPLLGPVDLSPWIDQLDWVIVGGESGHNARPMHPGWVCSIRDQCTAADVAFFFKQWGEWRPFTAADSGGTIHRWGDKVGTWCARVGKKKAGRLLDGREWSQFPKVSVPC
jgi:protein gp37